MRKISAGASSPEARFTPAPFYYADVNPVIYRWEQLNWDYDARQRWFYEQFTGRTYGTVWQSECFRQDENTQYHKSIQGGYFSDPLAWTMPPMTQAVASYRNNPIAFSNYLILSQQYRPANLYCNRAADPVATIDHLYVAPRHVFGRVGMRVDMCLPSAAQLAARGSTGAGATNIYTGFEVNSNGGSQIFAFRLTDDGATLAYQCLIAKQTPDGLQIANGAPVTINNPLVWCEYYLEFDPPVFRFIQPTAGQTTCMNYPDVTEISCPSLAATPMIQPFIANESEVSTSDPATNPLTWYVGHWAIFPMVRIGNAYKIQKRTNPNATCSPFYSIFDSGGRPYLHINVKTLGCGCAYTIEHCETGEDQPALSPEARTWRRIDDSDYTGVTATPSGEAGIGLFNAARFLRVTLSGCNACGTEEIVFTANAGGER